MDITNNLDSLFFSLLAALVVYGIHAAHRRRLRRVFIDGYDFPPRVTQAIRTSYPHLSEQQVLSVIEGLRDYFQICQQAGKTLVSMPSQVVDVAWHEFILFTRDYQYFCHKGLGRFLHHTPAEAMKSPTDAQQGIKRAWRLACAREGINPRTPARLPRLFALDATLGIANGFTYSLLCDPARQNDGFCAGHIGCSSGCGGDSGGDSGDSGCGGGCGGD